mgnify:CR=1 FL=1
METKKKVGLNAIFLALTLVVNALGAFGLINGTSQSEVSDKYFTLVISAGFTFSIWSVIYGLLIASLVVMYLRREKEYYQKTIDKITPFFILTCLLNISWIVLFSFEMVEVAHNSLLEKHQRSKNGNIGTKTKQKQKTRQGTV